LPVNLEKTTKEEIRSLTNGKALTKGNLVALCGPSGSGKSTISVVVKREIEKEYKTKLLFIDLRNTEAQKYFDDTSEFKEASARGIILDKFEKDFELNPDNPQSKIRVQLLHFLLSNEKRIRARTQPAIFNVFASLRNRAALIYSRVSQNFDSFEEWFLENAYIIELGDIIDDTNKLIDIGHYIAFLKYKNKYEDFIIWLDNIDAFPNVQQSQILSFLQNIQRNFMNSSTIVVSVREENIYRLGEYHDNFNEPFISKITFDDPDGGIEGSDCYDSINVPVLKESELKQIIDNKLKFTRKKYKEAIEKLGKRIKSYQNELLELKDKNKANAIKDKIQKTTSEREEMNNDLIDDIDFSEIERISYSIMELFHNEKVIFLSNNSVKEFIRIHSAYLLYLFKKKNFDSSDYLNQSDSARITEFLSWIHTVDAPFGLETLNVVEESGKYLNDTKRKLACFLPYIIVTAIWNESIKLYGKPSPGNNPFLKTIVKQIKKDFGFKRSVIRQAVFDLYDQAGGKGNFITFRNKKLLEHPDDLDERSTVRVTYRGKVAIGHTINSYGYLKECISRIENDLNDGGNIQDKVMDKIVELSNQHLESLIELRESTYNNDADWWLEYNFRYGIPLDSRFVRDSEIGNPLPNCKYRRAIYLEAVFDSLTDYFHIPNKYEKRATRLSGLFMNKLERIYKLEFNKSTKININE